MEYTICAVICILVLIGGVSVMVYCDAEPSTEIGIRTNAKPGLKINEKYCYNIRTNSYDICL